MYPLEQRQARNKYIQHKCSVKRRVDALGNPIEFKLTFDEWYKIWLDSGHWHERGCSKGKYVMSRHNDVGHYEIGNVCIKQVEKNISEGHIGLKATEKCKQRASEVNRKPIMTPDGQFESRRQAAKHYGITPEGIGVRLKYKPQEYYYL